jgi:peptidoglycan hydrolase-like protein with peptidoglycan-binding domain
MKTISKIAAIALVAVALVGVNTASAATVAELQAMIASLSAQIAALSGTPSTPAAVTFTSNLTVGSTGAEVTALQNFLIGKGYNTLATGYFGPMTKAALAAYQTAKGITPAAGYFGPLTRASVNGETPATTGGTTTTGSTGLTGGAGDLADISKITSGTETTVAEGKTEKVLGLELEADDNSDLAITSMRVTADVTGSGSTRLSRYVDEVIIYMGTKEVGSMDAADFSRDGANNTGTVSLKDAVIKKGEKVRFYVALKAQDVIESADIVGGVTVGVDRTRFEDASGAVLTDTTTGLSEEATFEDSAESDGAKVQSSSATPDSAILKVDDNSTSDDYSVLMFKLKGDTDSSDTLVTSLPVVLSIYNASTTSINAADLIDDIYLMVGSTKYDDVTMATGTIGAATTTSKTYTFNIDEGDLKIAGGATSEVKVYVSFGNQDGKYASSGTKVTASVTGSAIAAENVNGDDIDLTGAATGEEMTVAISAATVDSFSWSVNNTGTILDFFFTVKSDDEDFSVLSSSLVYATSGTATTSAGVLSLSSGDATTVTAGTEYTVVAGGESATFRVRWNVNGTNGQYLEVKTTSVAGQTVPDTKQTSPTATRNVQS